MSDRLNKRNVAYVFDVKDGRQHAASEYLGPGIDLESQVNLRHYLAEAFIGNKPPRLRCYDCRKLLKVRKNRKEGYHFWHASESCIHAGSGTLSRDRLNAIKYNGQKESEAHHELKSKLAYYLEQMEEVGEGNVTLEKHVVSDLQNHTYRKPDINFKYKDLRIAMEVQLSTTWLDVILAREQFYRENKMFVIWVFNSFENDDTKRRAAWNDILFANDSHAYLFDSETERMSAKTKRLHLKVYYREYWIDENDELEVDYESDLIDFKEITFDNNGYRHYYKDVKARKQELEEEIRKREKIWIAEQKKQRLQREKKYAEAAKRREEIREELRSHDIEVHRIQERLDKLNESKSHQDKLIKDADGEIWTAERNESNIDSAYNDLVYDTEKRIGLKYMRTDHVATLISDHKKLSEMKILIDELQKVRDKIWQKEASLRELRNELQRFNQLEDQVVDGQVFKIIPFEANKEVILNEPYKFYFFDRTVATDLFNKPSLEKIESGFKVNQNKYKLQSGNLIVLYDPSLKVPDLVQKINSLESKIKELESEVANNEAIVVAHISQAYNQRKNELSLCKERYTKLRVRYTSQLDAIVNQISDKEVKLAEYKEEIKRLNDQHYEFLNY